MRRLLFARLCRLEFHLYAGLFVLMVITNHSVFNNVHTSRLFRTQQQDGSLNK